MTERPGPKRVIVNADDFGFSAAISDGILRAHREGIVTSTTLAANMPAAAEAAGRLADAPDLGVGVHLNASQGPPLSEPGRVLAGDDGQMSRGGLGLIRACMCRPALLGVIEAEFDTQIRWVLDRGISPTHLDTHRHCHGYGPIFARVIGLARRYDIPYVRRHREVLPGRGWPWAPLKQRGIRLVLNALGRCRRRKGSGFLATDGTWGIAHTGLIDAAWLILAAQRAPVGVVEIMTHPGCGDGLAAGLSRLGERRRAELAALCDPAVRLAFEQADVELIHYGHLHGA